MRLDHVAYRVADRNKTAEFFRSAFGYRVQQEFVVDFGDGQYAECIAMEPPEKRLASLPWMIPFAPMQSTYHLAPEVFISDGTPGSIVGDWVAARGGVGGIHHLAYQVDSVEGTMREWVEQGWAEFSSAEPMRCPEDGLVQVFTKPLPVLGGMVIELIERQGHGFCSSSVKALMESSRGL